jgi:hypothetical protein
MASGNRARGLAIGAVVVSALLAGTAAYALDQATDDSAPTVLSSPEPVVTESPTAEPTVDPTLAPIPTLTPLPTLSPTPTSTASPTHSASPTASQTAVVTASPTPRRIYPYPKPTTVYAGLALSAKLIPRGGSQYAVSVVTEDDRNGATDGDGTIYLESLSWNDGPLVRGVNPTSCRSYPPLTSPPGPYQPEPDSKRATYEHTYPSGPANYHIVLTIRSVNADCKPNGPKPETATLEFDVEL